MRCAYTAGGPARLGNAGAESVRHVQTTLRAFRRRHVNFAAAMDRLMEFELALRDLYGWLAAGFGHRPEVAKVFGRLSLQEQAHANLVRYQRRMATANGSAFLPLDGGLEEVDRLLGEIAEFRVTRPNPSLPEAIGIAKRLEQSAAERLHRTAVARSNPALADFIDRLAGDDQKHLEMLQELESRFLAKAS
jgi:rubrerythrin